MKREYFCNKITDISIAGQFIQTMEEGEDKQRMVALFLEARRNLNREPGAQGAWHNLRLELGDFVFRNESLHDRFEAICKLTQHSVHVSNIYLLENTYLLD